MQLSEIESIHNYSSNPEVLKYTSASTPNNISQTQAFVRHIVESGSNDYYFALCVKPSKMCRGIIDFSYKNLKAEIHYGIAKSI